MWGTEVRPSEVMRNMPHEDALEDLTPSDEAAPASLPQLVITNGQPSPPEVEKLR